MTEQLKGLKAYRLRSSSGNWAVKPIIGESHIVNLYGLCGSGKSILAWFIAHCVSRGISLLDKYEAEPGRVLIIDEETPEADYELRLGTILGWDNENVDTFPRPDEWGFKWSDNTWWARLIDKVKEFEPTMIIWDNLNALQGDWDLEGSNTDVGKLRRRFNDLRTYNPKIVNLFIHHEGMTPNKPRGSTAIKDMSDTVIHLKRVWDNPFRFAVIQEPRKRPAGVKPFIVELDAKEGAETWDLIFIGEEENAGLPSLYDTSVFEYFIANHKVDLIPNGKVTVKGILTALQGDIGERNIRESINNLTDTGAIIKKRGAHNLGSYMLADTIPNNHFNRALAESLKEHYPDMGISIEPPL